MADRQNIVMWLTSPLLEQQRRHPRSLPHNSTQMKDRKPHSTCMICLQKPNDETLITRIAKLDTGSDVNIMSQKVFSALKMNMDAYEGPPIRGLKEGIKPLGQVKVDWHVSQKTKTYTDEFVVLDDSSTKSFDILLGDPTIERVSFYKRNENVWILGYEDC